MIKQFYKKYVSEKKRIEAHYFINKVVAPFYMGNRLYCNCCGKRFRKFLSKGNIQRENAKCPYCGSLERTRLLHLYLLNETKIFEKNASVLHIAPEKCLHTIFKKQDIEYIDGDINPAYASNIVDITDILYPDNYFDFIICSHVLGHIPDEEKAIQEMKRVLKKRGTAIVMTLINLDSETTFEDKSIISESDRLKNYGESDLCRLHGLDFGERLQKQGFMVESIDYRKKLPPEIVANSRMGDGSRELIFKCSK